MQIRTVELITEGASLGDSFLLEIERPAGRLNLEVPTRFSLFLSREGPGSMPVALQFSKGEGIESQTERWETVDSDGDDRKQFDIELTLTGEKGESMIRFLLKGEEFRATLAMEEIDLYIGSSPVGLSVPGSPIQWDLTDGLWIDLDIRFKGSPPKFLGCQLVLIDPDGNQLHEYSKQMLEMKGSPVTRMKVLPPDRVIEGAVDGLFRLDIEGDHQEVLVASFLRVVPSDGSDPSNIAKVDSDRIERPETRTSLDGDQTRTAPVILMDCIPSTVATGGSVRLIIDVTSVNNEDVSARIDLDNDLIDPIETGPLSEDGHFETVIRLDERVQGDIGGRVSVVSKDIVVAEHAYTRLLSVSSEHTLPFEVILPSPSERTAGEGAGSYLFPGEKVRSRTDNSGIILARTDLGRIMIERGDDILPVDEDDEITASRVVIHDTFINAFTSGGLIDRLDGSFERTLQIVGLLNGGIDESVLSGESGFTGTLARAFKDLADDPALRIHSKDGKDPLSNMSLLLREITGDQGYCGATDPAGSLTTLMERIIKENRRGEGQIDRHLAAFAMSEVCRRGRSAIKELRKIESGKKQDPREVSSVLRRLSFYILSHSLVRVELMSRWSDPVVSVWDEMRIARQRGIKSSVQDVMETVKRLSDIHNAADARWRTYLDNLERRKRIRSVSLLEIRKVPENLKGIAGSEWTMHIVIDPPSEAYPVSVTPHIVLPRGGWSLEYPRSLRDGERVVLDPISIKPGERRDIELRISSPVTIGDTGMVKMYLHPDDIELEEEP